MRAFPKGPPKPVEERIAETILGAAVVSTTLLVSPVAGVAAFFLAVGAGGYLFRKKDFNREVKRLEKRGYVALTKTPKGYIIRLLEKGRQGHRKVLIHNLKFPIGRWDGKWRLFIFDIPEKLRTRRDLLRRKLKDLGLYNIQRSVFVYPYDCREELALVADYYKVEKYTTYAETDYIDIDMELKNHFKSKKLL